MRPVRGCGKSLYIVLHCTRLFDQEYERHLTEHEKWSSQQTLMRNELSRSHAILDQLEKNKYVNGE